MSRLDLTIVCVYELLLVLLAIYSLHRAYLVRLRRRCASATPLPIEPCDEWPAVVVQLPLFNEPNVAARLVDAVAAIEYRGRLEIQLLDDSTDETTAILEARVAHWRALGVDVRHIRREARDGFKAGALAHGMARTNCDFFAVFDADFVPSPDVLTRMMPFFRDPAVGMVQARWGHLNRTRSLLTRVQAIYLDAHFAVESAARCLGRRFFNFNGTAGIWRRAAIEDAGGWSSSTLTEDLDLSYRAQLAGWRFAFLPDVEVPAELPATLSGFQEQQHRWAKGSIQTARKNLGAVLRSALPLRVKVEALFHLTNNVAYVLTLLVALLMVPSILIRQRLGLTSLLLLDVVLFVASSGSVLLFYLEGQRQIGRPTPALRELAAVLPIGIGISIRNAAAVLEGLLQQGGYFRRTPKRGNAAHELFERRPRVPWSELVMASFFWLTLAMFVAAREWISLPFLLLFVSGYSYVAAFAIAERIGFRRPT